jgi:5-deoxy-glucuronate isomerase
MTERVVASAAPPNDLAPEELRLAPGVPVTPQRAGWRYLSFCVAELSGPVAIGMEDEEVAVVVLAGALELEVAGRRHALPGRASVWEGLPWAAYLPAGVIGSVRSVDGAATVAIASAPSQTDRASDGPAIIGPSDVQVEVRGAGNATRQITHIIAPDFPADRLELVEVYTPSGNWSSWPPHKHDVDDMPHEAVLEEIYCYQFRRPQAWGVQRLYRRDGSRDGLWAVRHGEVVLVTDGYHPFAATHGDDAYYLNALAGDRRTMACSYDPELDWVRAAWPDMEPDPRVPLVGGNGG